MNKTSLIYELSALSPLDGRYSAQVKDLSEIFSEKALIQKRIFVEVEYLVFLSKKKIVRKISSSEQKILEKIGKNLTESQILRVKELEAITNHDFKAAELALKEFLSKTSLRDITEMIHFGLTSYDVNNICQRLMLSEGLEKSLLPTLQRLISELTDKSDQYKEIVMIGRTHGQRAVPTTLGKELVIFAVRLNRQLQKLKEAKLTGKFNGAIGNYNALKLVKPEVDWISFSKEFIKSLGLTPNIYTTQINHYDDIVEVFESIHMVNSILIGLNQDIWRYVSDEWLKQKVIRGEVGSSAMPQKVNPIHFENSEGNLQMANSLLEGMSTKLLISRLQRDLSDSTVIRNVGLTLGYCLLAYKSLITGLSRIEPNASKIYEELDSDWSILTEALQNEMRNLGIKGSHALVQEAIRGQKMTQNDWESLVNKLIKENKTVNKLLKLTPQTYSGDAVKLTKLAIKEIRS